MDPTTVPLPGQDHVLTPALLLQQRTKLHCTCVLVSTHTIGIQPRMITKLEIR